MKTYLSFVPSALLAGVVLFAVGGRGAADSVDSAERAFHLASRFTDMGYYVTPFRDSHDGFDSKCELTVPVSTGLEYVFVVAGEHKGVDLDVWVEAEETGNRFASDSHYRHSGLGGVRWRAEHDGEVRLTIHFAKCSSHCEWNAILARRASPSPGGRAGSEEAVSADHRDSSGRDEIAAEPK